MKNIPNTFLGNYESQKAETWYKHGQWVVVLCLPKLGPRAYNSWSYFFLVGFHIYVFICHQWKFLVTLFSGTMKARKLKLGINLDNGWLYCAYRIWGLRPIALAVISLDSIFFSIYYAFCLFHSVLVDLLQGNFYHTCSAG